MSDPSFGPLSTARLVDRLVIQGVGLIGGSLGMAARRYGLAREVVGAGRDAGRLETAMRVGAVHRYVTTRAAMAQECGRADMIVLCTPVSTIIEDLPWVLEAAGPNAAVTDVGSVKAPIVAAARGDHRFVGSHPMAGSEMAGVEAARVNLFQEATWALTPLRETSPDALERVRSLAQGVGANTRTLDAVRHDAAVALTSHLPHVLAYALMAQAGAASAADPDVAFLSAGGFASATRVAGSLPSLWRDIVLANAGPLGAALTEYRARLAQLHEAIERGDAEEIGRLFAEGYDSRRDWPRQ